MSKKFIFVAALVISTSAFAGKGAEGEGGGGGRFNPYEGMDYGVLCNQSDILLVHEEQLKNEGLGDLIVRLKNRDSLERQMFPRVRTSLVKHVLRRVSAGLYSNYLSLSKGFYGHLDSIFTTFSCVAAPLQQPDNGHDLINFDADPLLAPPSQDMVSILDEQQSLILQVEHRIDDDSSEALVHFPDTTAEINKALIEDFLKKKADIIKGNMLAALVPTGVDLGLAAAMGLVMGPAGAGGVAVKALSTVKTSIKDFASSGVLLLSPEADPLLEAELKFITKWRYLEENLREKIEAKFTAARSNPKLMVELKDYIPYALHMPFHSVQPRMDFEAPLKKLVQGYTTEGDASLEIVLRNAMIAHLARYTSKYSSAETSKVVLYIEGLPGLGKTHLAHKIAEMMGLPYYEVSLKDNTKEVLGDAKNPGNLARALSRNPNGASNGVLIFDEGDRAINAANGKSGESELLTLLAPSAKKVYLPYIESEIDISKYFVIVLGNNPIKDEAMRSRFKMVKITGMSAEMKRDIVLHDILPPLAHSEIQGLLVEITHKDREEIEALIKADQDPGLRSIERSLSDWLSNKRVPLLRKMVAEEEREKPLHHVFCPPGGRGGHPELSLQENM